MKILLEKEMKRACYIHPEDKNKTIKLHMKIIIEKRVNKLS